MHIAFVDCFNTHSDVSQILEASLLAELLNSCDYFFKRWIRVGPVGMTSHLMNVGKEDSSGEFFTVSLGEIAK